MALRTTYVIEIERVAGSSRDPITEEARCAYVAAFAEDVRELGHEANVVPAGVEITVQAADSAGSDEVTTRTLYALVRRATDMFNKMAPLCETAAHLRRFERVVGGSYQHRVAEAVKAALRDADSALVNEYLKSLEPSGLRHQPDLGLHLTRARLSSFPEGVELLKRAESARQEVPDFNPYLLRVGPAFIGSSLAETCGPPARQEVHLPLAADSARTARDPDRRRLLLRDLAVSRYPGRADTVVAALTTTVRNQHLVLSADHELASEVALALLQPPPGRRTRVIDGWRTPWSPYSAAGSLLLIAAATAGSCLPITLCTFGGAAVLLSGVVSAVTLLGFRRGANPTLVTLGMTPVLIVWVFAMIYAQGGWVTAGDGQALQRWIDPTLFSLSVATTVGYLDYSVSDDIWVRLLTFVEMILVVSILGGTLVSAFRAVMETLRSRSQDG